MGGTDQVHIIKLQLALESNHPGGAPAMFFNKAGNLKGFLPVNERILKAMHGRFVAFFFARIVKVEGSEALAGGVSLEIGEEAPAQDW